MKMMTNYAIDDVQLLRNLKVVLEAIPFAYNIVLKWGCAKTKEVSYKDYITAKCRTKLKDENKWIKSNSEKLKKHNCDDGDARSCFLLLLMFVITFINLELKNTRKLFRISRA
jgi:hypothetical protein